MRGDFLISSNEGPAEGNIYANKSALVLNWLLSVGISRDLFSLREVAKDAGVSLGLVQRVFGVLVLKGLLNTEGVRTAKRFFFKKSGVLIKSWLGQYNIMKKCKVRTYRSGFQGRSELLEALKESSLSVKTALALHSAAEAHKCSNTNLSTLELYLLDPSIRLDLEDTLQMEPQEKGYDVLLIEPYYKSLINLNAMPNEGLNLSSPLLTYLDLYHFPLRGREQADFMAEHIPELKRIYDNGKPHGS